MNREEHLRASVPKWLKIPKLREIVIVDWSNRNPLMELTQLDPRIRVIRVENEPRWVLSYAYNIGIQAASEPFVIKCDADCIPTINIANYRPGQDYFYAGHWKSGAALGKASVNGQCIFSTSQFKAVNGYSEYIRTYGRDDEDFYERLQAAGFERKEVPPAILDFMEHSQEARMSNQVNNLGEQVLSIDAQLSRYTVYNEMRNAWIARYIPWGPTSPQATFRMIEQGTRWSRVERNKSSEFVLTPEQQAEAQLFALRYLITLLHEVSQGTANSLDAQACLRLLALAGRFSTQQPQPSKGAIAYAMHVAGYFDLAVELAAAALKADSKDLDALLVMGSSMLRAKNYPIASRVLRLGMMLSPDDMRLKALEEELRSQPGSVM